ASNIGRNLTVTANTGSITQNGAVNVAGGTAAFTANLGAVTLPLGNNFLSLALNAGAGAQINDTGTLSFATSHVTGNLAVSVGSDLNQSGPLGVTGSLSVQAGGAVNLGDAGN